MGNRSKEDSKVDRNTEQLVQTAREMQYWAQCILRVADAMEHEKIPSLSIARAPALNRLEKSAKIWARACEDALADHHKDQACKSIIPGLPTGSQASKNFHGPNKTVTS